MDDKEKEDIREITKLCDYIKNNNYGFKNEADVNKLEGKAKVFEGNYPFVIKDTNVAMAISLLERDKNQYKNDLSSIINYFDSLNSD